MYFKQIELTPHIKPWFLVQDAQHEQQIIEDTRKTKAFKFLLRFRRTFWRLIQGAPVEADSIVDHVDTLDTLYSNYYQWCEEYERLHGPMIYKVDHDAFLSTCLLNSDEVFKVITC